MLPGMRTLEQIGNAVALRRGATTSAASSLRRLFVRKVRHADIKGERELELIRAAKAGDRSAREILDQAHLPLVYMTVRRYFGHGVDEEDLIQEGRMGLQHAVAKFDEARGVTFATYALRWVRSYAAIYLSEQCSDIRVAPKVRGAYGRMLRRGGTERDLATSPDPEDRTLLAHLQAVVPPVRLDEPVSTTSNCTVGDLVPTPGPGADDDLDAARRSSALASLLPRLVAELPPQEREVVVRRYPLDESVAPQTQVEIAGSFERGRIGTIVTRQRIQQIEVSALDRLARRLAGDELVTGNGSTSIR